MASDTTASSQFGRKVFITGLRGPRAAELNGKLGTITGFLNTTIGNERWVIEVKQSRWSSKKLAVKAENLVYMVDQMISVTKYPPVGALTHPRLNPTTHRFEPKYDDWRDGFAYGNKPWNRPGWKPNPVDNASTTRPWPSSNLGLIKRLGSNPPVDWSADEAAAFWRSWKSEILLRDAVVFRSCSEDIYSYLKTCALSLTELVTDPITGKKRTQMNKPGYVAWAFREARPEDFQKSVIWSDGTKKCQLSDLSDRNINEGGWGEHYWWPCLVLKPISTSVVKQEFYCPALGWMHARPWWAKSSRIFSVPEHLITGEDGEDEVADVNPVGAATTYPVATGTTSAGTEAGGTTVAAAGAATTGTTPADTEAGGTTVSSDPWAQMAETNDAALLAAFMAADDDSGDDEFNPFAGLN